LPSATAHAEPSECGDNDDSHRISDTCSSAQSNSGGGKEGNKYPGRCHRNGGGDANYLSNLFIGWFLTPLFASL